MRDSQTDGWVMTGVSTRMSVGGTIALHEDPKVLLRPMLKRTKVGVASHTASGCTVEDV